jgi:preprotein translocase subunit SecA
MGLIKRLFDSEYKELSKFKKIADKIEALDEEYQKKIR